MATEAELSRRYTEHHTMLATPVTYGLQETPSMHVHETSLPEPASFSVPGVGGYRAYRTPYRNAPTSLAAASGATSMQPVMIRDDAYEADLRAEYERHQMQMHGLGSLPGQASSPIDLTGDYELPERSMTPRQKWRPVSSQMRREKDAAVRASQVSAQTLRAISAEHSHARAASGDRLLEDALAKYRKSREPPPVLPPIQVKIMVNVEDQTVTIQNIDRRDGTIAGFSLRAVKTDGNSLEMTIPFGRQAELKAGASLVVLCTYQKGGHSRAKDAGHEWILWDILDFPTALNDEQILGSEGGQLVMKNDKGLTVGETRYPRTQASLLSERKRKEEEARRRAPAAIPESRAPMLLLLMMMMMMMLVRLLLLLPAR